MLRMYINCVSVSGNALFCLNYLELAVCQVAFPAVIERASLQRSREGPANCSTGLTVSCPVVVAQEKK